MSSTSRGSDRQEDDFYATPEWCVYALLHTINLPGGEWLEPAVGDGAIVGAVNKQRTDVKWAVNDIMFRGFDEKYGIKQLNYVYDADGIDFDKSADVVITNPPFNQALDFVKGAMKDGKIVVMLLRLNWLASKARNRFLIDNPPSVYVLPKRPAFINGRTDSCEYAWFVWGLDAIPKCQVIDIEVCDWKETQGLSLGDLFGVED